jgi:SAM-dependent methyltransferase
LVEPGGRVRAVDRGAEAVEAARTRLTKAGADNVSVEVADADNTGIPPGTVDVVMIRHVLAHNGSREEAIVGHAASLVRPGGFVYLVATLAPAIRMRPADPDLDDLTARYDDWHDRQGNDLSVGLRLGELLSGAGLEAVQHHGRYAIFQPPVGFRTPPWAARDTLVAAGLATSDDVERWRSAFDRFDAAPRPTIFLPQFYAWGHRPTA